MDDKLFDKFDKSLSRQEFIELFHAHITQLLHWQIGHPERSVAIAYQIAGLMNAESVRTLDNDDPYRQVFDIAGELELPVAHRNKDASWERLRQLVAGLTEASS